MKNKIEIMKTKPDISDEEIRSYMDFEGLLRQGTAIQARRRTWNKIFWGLAGIASIAFVSFLLWNDSPKETNTVASDNVQGSQVPFDSATRSESTTSHETDSKAIQAESDEEHAAAAGHIKRKEPATAKTESAKEHEPTLNNAPATSNETTSFTEATPIDGYPHLYEFLNTQLKYPEAALADSIQGVMTVSFVVSENGTIESITFVNSLGPLFEIEANRLMKEMPDWKPASINGKPVSSRLSLPLTFRIETIKN